MFIIIVCKCIVWTGVTITILMLLIAETEHYLSY